MGRTIDIELILDTGKTKNLTIEFDRETVLQLMEAESDKKDKVSSTIDMLYFGCLKHHKDDMPTRDELASLLVSADDFEGLVTAITDLVKDVLEAIKKSKEQGNSKWVVRG